MLIGAEFDAQPSYSRQSSFAALRGYCVQDHPAAAVPARPADPADVGRHLRHLGRLLSPIMGATGVDGFLVTTGWGTWGFKAIPAGGEGMAELIATGRPPRAHRAVHARPVPARPRPGRPGLGGDALMLWLDCPRCGRRPLDEFTFGGERRPVPDWITDPDERDFDEVWIFENPDGRDDRALVPRVRLPALADGPPRHLDRHGRSRSSVTRAGRPPDRDRPAQPGPVRGRRDRATPRGGRRGRRLARLRRDRPGRPRARASSTASSASSRRPASRPASSPRSSRTRAPRPSSAARRRCAASGSTARSSSPVGGGSSMDTAKALDLRATNDLPVWDLEYDGPDLAPGRPVVAVPTTAGTGAETQLVRGHHRRGGRPQGLHRPSVAAARRDDPRPGPDRRAAAGRDGRDRRSTR